MPYQDSDNFEQTFGETQDDSQTCTADDSQSLTDHTYQVNQPKKKGRPRGAKNGTGRGIASKTRTTRANMSETKALPKMKTNVHQIKLSSDQINHLKTVESFGQPGVCFQIAPKLDNCFECNKYTSNRRKEKKDIECRFYQFRKLRYNGDELEVAGFLDPIKDPVDVDKSIWSPLYEKTNRFKTLSIEDSRLILSHVGEQFCQLIEEEKVYHETYKTEGKPNIWKRLIE